jgi:hypothetical protein
MHAQSFIILLSTIHLRYQMKFYRMYTHQQEFGFMKKGGMKRRDRIYRIWTCRKSPKKKFL